MEERACIIDTEGRSWLIIQQLDANVNLWIEESEFQFKGAYAIFKGWIDTITPQLQGGILLDTMLMHLGEGRQLVTIGDWLELNRLSIWTKIQVSIEQCTLLETSKWSYQWISDKNKLQCKRLVQMENIK